jgi:hypothetical protein
MPTKEWLQGRYDSCSLATIASELRVHRNTVRNWCIRLGITRRPHGALLKGRPKSAEQRAKMSQARFLYWNRHTNRDAFKLKLSASKGTHRTKDGRPYFYILNRGSVRAHRLVVEQALGRRLKASEHVHHKDDNRANNALDNLQIVSASEHARIHIHWRKRNAKGQFVC